MLYINIQWDKEVSNTAEFQKEIGETEEQTKKIMKVKKKMWEFFIK